MIGDINKFVHDNIQSIINHFFEHFFNLLCRLLIVKMSNLNKYISDYEIDLLINENTSDEA